MSMIARFDPLTLLLLAVREATGLITAGADPPPVAAGHLVLGITSAEHHRRQATPAYLHGLRFDGFFQHVREINLTWGKAGPDAWQPSDSIRVDDLPLHGAASRLGRRSDALLRLKNLREELEGEIRQGRYGVVTAHDPHLLGLLGLVLAKRTGIPFVLHLNSNFENKYRQTGKVSFAWLRWRWLERAVERLVMGAADVIVADRRYYRDCGFVPARYHHKYRAVGVFSPFEAPPDPARRLAAREALGVGDETLLLYVGRLHPHKLAEDLIPLARRLAERRQDWTLVLAGDGPLRQAMEAEAKPLGARVRFLGNQPPEKLADLYRAADVMVATHGGVTLLEAATAAKATLAYDYDWMGEFIRDRQNGRLVPVRDIEALAAAVEEVLEQPALAMAWGEAARADVRAHHDREQALANERAVYADLAGAKQGKR